MKNRMLAAALLACLAGCASVPMAPAQADAEAKRFQPQADAGTLYVFRDAAHKGAAITLPVVLDGRIVGASARLTYMRLTLAPGKHILASPTAVYRSMNLQAEAGKLYFVRHAPVSEFLLQTISGEFEAVEEAEGRAAVSGCQLAETNL